MSTRCKGCNAVIKRSGLYPHFLLSRNPQCELYRLKLDDGTLFPNNDGELAASGAQAHTTKRNSFEGFDQDEWEDTDRGLEGDKDKDKDEDEEDTGADEDEDADELLAEDEYGLEPPRPPVETRINPNQKEDLPQARGAFRLRGRYEGPLKNVPFVVKFPGMAGYSHIDSATAADAHQDDLNDSALGASNPFSPFSSKMDWEIARWAKLRGPGSTAFSELMSIEGVSGAFFIQVLRM